MRNIVEAKVCDGCSYNLQITYADNRRKNYLETLAEGLLIRWQKNLLRGYLNPDGRKK